MCEGNLGLIVHGKGAHNASKCDAVAVGAGSAGNADAGAKKVREIVVKLTGRSGML